MELVNQNASAYSLIINHMVKLHLQDGPKNRPLRLTAYIFKMSELICVIFGKIKHCFVMNTSVSSILNKFITQVAQPSNKSTTY